MSKKPFIFALQAIIALSAWAAINSYIPNNIIKNLSDDSKFASQYDIVLIIMLIASPFMYLLGEIWAQRFVEIKFIDERIKFFKKYQGQRIAESNLFSQNASIIKEGIRISKVDIPVFISANIILISSMAGKNNSYISAVISSYIIGFLSIAIPYLLSRNKYSDLAFVDSLPLELFKNYASMYPTFSYGTVNKKFIGIFLKSSAIVKEKILLSVKDSILPSTLISCGTLTTFSVAAYLFFINDESIKNLIPLYFHITLITNIFLQLSAKIPTYIGYKAALKKYNVESINFAKKIISIEKISDLFELKLVNGTAIQISKKTSYKIVGINGIGKSTFLREFAKLAEKITNDVLYLNASSDLDVINNVTQHQSDGQRQINNLNMALQLMPNILILDESTSNIDSINLKLIIEKLKVYLQSGGIIFYVTHDTSDYLENSISITM
jgi:energy-coupling factor transporter ATP-binding protein EcfA2